MREFKDWKGEIEGVPWWKFKITLHIHYFDSGYGRLSIVKYFWLILAGGSILEGINYVYAIYGGFLYCITCYIFGWWWYNHMQSAAIEVINQIDPFAKGVRKVYKSVVPK